MSPETSTENFDNFYKKMIRKVSEDLPCGLSIRDTDGYFSSENAFKDLKENLFNSAHRGEKLNLSAVSDFRNKIEKIFKKSKDLQIAMWLLYCLCVLEGIVGLKIGLQIIEFMVGNFWDHFYPREIESRIRCMDWINEHIAILIRSLMPVYDEIRAYEMAKDDLTERLKNIKNIEDIVKKASFLTEDCLKISSSIEKSFKGNEISFKDLKAAISDLKAVNKDIERTHFSVRASEEVRTIMEMDDKDHEDLKNVRDLVLRDKIYKEIDSNAAILLQMNKRDIIALIIKDAINKLRNREVADILQFLIDDQIYLNYIQRLIKMSEK